MNDERWLPVVGFEGSYEVSDHGIVRSLQRPFVLETKMLMPWLNTRGYLMVSLCINGMQHNKFVHKLVLEAFVGPCPDGMQTRHRDGISIRNTLSNLTWGTQVQNEKDKNVHGTSNQGERNGRSKLSAVDVLAIRSAIGLQRDIAELYGIDQSTVSCIKSRKKWGHLD